MNATELFAMKRLIKHVLVTSEGMMPLHLADTLALVRSEEELMQREADWYEHQRLNAQREYDEMMLRGDE